VIHLRRGDVYIDVITSSTASATFPIINFWSTGPMCFLTGSALQILYPRLQEDNRILLNPFRLRSDEPFEPPLTLIDVVGKHKAQIRSLIAKYVDRGYDVQHTEHDWNPSLASRVCLPNRAEACPLAIRWVGDPCCMQLSLLGDASIRMHKPAFQHRLAQFTSVWCRGGFPCGPLCSERPGPVDAIAYTIAHHYIG
ncbi:hypothetical protein LXA43DRAFT_904095, partial [Ganoderma leucocontextum]